MIGLNNHRLPGVRFDSRLKARPKRHVTSVCLQESGCHAVPDSEPVRGCLGPWRKGSESGTAWHLEVSPLGDNCPGISWLLDPFNSSCDVREVAAWKAGDLRSHKWTLKASSDRFRPVSAAAYWLS